MNQEDAHDDAGMDLMFGPRPTVIKNEGQETHWWPGRRADLSLVSKPAESAPQYRISIPRPVPRSERASTQLVGVLFLLLALCIGGPIVAHIASYLRAFLHGLG